MRAVDREVRVSNLALEKILDTEAHVVMTTGVNKKVQNRVAINRAGYDWCENSVPNTCV